MSGRTVRIVQGAHRSRDRHHRGELALALFAGTALGYFVGCWFARTGDPVSEGELGDPDESWADRWGERMDAAVEAGTRSFDEWRRRWSRLPPVDAAAARRRLRGVEGAGGIRVHDLGDGIVELVGEAPDGVVDAAVAAMEALPGVRIVVRRIWSTPDRGN